MDVVILRMCTLYMAFCQSVLFSAVVIKCKH